MAYFRIFVLTLVCVVAAVNAVDFSTCKSYAEEAVMMLAATKPEDWPDCVIEKVEKWDAFKKAYFDQDSKEVAQILIDKVENIPKEEERKGLECFGQIATMLAVNSVIPSNDCVATMELVADGLKKLFS